MYLIDQTYFTRNYNVPNVDEMDSKTATDLDSCIDQYVRLFLQKSLGYSLWNELDQNIIDGVLKTDTPQKWIDLINGVSYVKDNTTYYWKGLIYTEGAFKGSLLVPFVYFNYLSENISILSGTGEKIADASNAINVNSSQRLVNAWNDFVSLYQGDAQNSIGKHYYHNGVSVVDYYSGNNSSNGIVDFVQFLIDKKEDYPNASLTRFEYQNQLGL